MPSNVYAGIKVEGIHLVRQFIARQIYWNVGGTLADMKKLNFNEVLHFRNDGPLNPLTAL